MYIRILESDDWIVEYEGENNPYRVCCQNERGEHEFCRGCKVRR